MWIFIENNYYINNNNNTYWYIYIKVNYIIPHAPKFFFDE